MDLKQKGSYILQWLSRWFDQFCNETRLKQVRFD